MLACSDTIASARDLISSKSGCQVFRSDQCENAFFTLGFCLVFSVNVDQALTWLCGAVLQSTSDVLMILPLHNLVSTHPKFVPEVLCALQGMLDQEQHVQDVFA